tara:strand:- start:508 stop:825 length:318 start_codon:yes stop_codon:yes gene_type:complete
MVDGRRERASLEEHARTIALLVLIPLSGWTLYTVNQAQLRDVEIAGKIQLVEQKIHSLSGVIDDMKSSMGTKMVDRFTGKQGVEHGSRITRLENRVREMELQAKR